MVKEYTVEQLKQMLRGLKASLKTFENVGDRESVYETKGHVRRIEAEIEARITCRHCHLNEVKDENEMCLECQICHAEAAEDR